ncbi:glutathione reductase, chloroplastic/mitochondrial-like [Brassica napus]|uniref:glutathione reductase, chloroplastic/mitochondrial-like n=1 Tax=Brassica napus TaxID=3708 RepID=UPI002078FAFB|nr:glutathione reductase, chloroplastic/mitochondrial-like [Brassica napus]
MSLHLIALVASLFEDKNMKACHIMLEFALRDNDVDLMTSLLEVIDPHTIDVDGKIYTSRNILIAVGGHPFIPDIPGREYAIDFPSNAKKIAIVGGGYIALEFAGIFNGLNIEVHVFIRQKKFRDFVGEQMSLRGIEFHTEESPEAIIKAGDGSLSLKTSKGTVDGCMPSSTRSNKEKKLLFSDPARLERSIRKEIRTASIDINACSLTDTRIPASTENLQPSTDTLHPTSIDTSSRTSIDTQPRDMVATFILTQYENGDMYDLEGHLRNAAGQEIDDQGAESLILKLRLLQLLLKLYRKLLASER